MLRLFDIASPLRSVFGIPFAENKVFRRQKFLKSQEKLFSRSFSCGGAGQSPVLFPTKESIMKIGFIGCGNMGGALARAAVKGVSAKNVAIAEKDEARAKAFADETGVTVMSAEDVIASSDYVFLGVKPQMLGQVLAGLQGALADRCTKAGRLVLVSMVAGVTTEKVQALAGGDYPVIRIMPNLPVSVGEGMILYGTAGGVTEEELDGFLGAMKEAGQFCRLEEKLMDAGTAVSGCGPAFVCLMIEALADGGVQVGLPRDKALLLAEQTLLGTAKLLLTTETQPGVLKDAVCSPGGSTIAGVHALEEGAFRGVTSDAVLAAYERTVELGK